MKITYRRGLGIALFLLFAASALAQSSSRSTDWSDPDDSSDQDNRQEWRAHRRFHHGREFVSFGHDSLLPAGQTANVVVSILGSSINEGDAIDAVSVFGNTRTTGSLRDSAVAVFGNVYVDGKVDDGAVAVFGNVELGPHAEIGGDVVTVFGSLQRDPAAIVHGGIQHVFGGQSGEITGLHIWIQHCLLYARPLALVPGIQWAWGLALALLLFYVLIAVIFRTGVSECVRTFESRPGHAILAAIVVMLLSPVLIVLLCVTLIGIAAVPFVFAALLCTGLFGKAVMLAWIGRQMTGRPATGPLSHPALAVLVGGAVVSACYLVPVLGLLMFCLLGVLGFGAVAYTLIRGVGARRLQDPTAPIGASAWVDPASSGFATSTNAGASANATTGADPTTSPDSGASADPATAQDSARSPKAGAWVPPAASLSSAAANSSASAKASTPFDPDASVDPKISIDSTASVDAFTTAGASQTPGASPSTQERVSTGTSAPSTPPPLILASLPRAGFWIRMAALLLDILLIGFATSVLNHTVHFHLILLAAYGAIMWKLRGSTVGGIVFDLRVVRVDGRDLEWETAIVRALGCFLSLAVAGLGFIWIAFDHDHQAWHDKIAGTVVVRVPKGVPAI